MIYIKTHYISIAIPNCGSFSIVDLVQDVMNFKELQQAVDYIADYFNITDGAIKGFGKKVKPQVIDREPPKKKEIDFNEKLLEYDDYILNSFIQYHAVEWLSEGISDEAMSKYEISFDLVSNSIIIPHRDIENRLVGIRQRNLDKRQVEVLKRKYVPHNHYTNKITYRHSLGKNLYGVNINKEEIRESKKCIIWESEKSTLLMDSYYGENPSVSVGGSSISDFQLNILKNLGVRDIYVFFDYETDMEKWEKKMEKIYNKIINWGFDCYYIPNEIKGRYLNEKDSPIDKGKDVFEILLKSSIKYEIELT